MPTEPKPVTLAQVVTKAVEVCSLSGDSGQLDELLERFEDSDEPIRAIGEIAELVADAIRAIAGAEPEPQLQMAGAVIVYLAYRRDELRAQPDELLKLAARAEFDGHPPPAIADWLAEQGVEVR